MTLVRRQYPLVRLMRCITCGSTYHGDAAKGYRRVRHAKRPACGTSATYRADRFEAQVATLMDRVRFDDHDVARILTAMRSASGASDAPDPAELADERERLQGRLTAGEITLETFSRSWRALDRPTPRTPSRPDEVRLRRAQKLLGEFGTLWRNPAVPDRLREEAIREIFERFDVDGPEIVAAHPLPNENAWLFGLVAVRDQSLRLQQGMGLVGARGIAPS
jgi:hypothetical protein